MGAVESMGNVSAISVVYTYSALVNVKQVKTGRIVNVFMTKLFWVVGITLSI